MSVDYEVLDALTPAGWESTKKQMPAMADVARLAIEVGNRVVVDLEEENMGHGSWGAVVRKTAYALHRRSFARHVRKGATV